MKEQEKYKEMLSKMIDETEKKKIISSEDLIKKLISELSRSERLSKYTHSQVIAK
ncbi:hypothetical protein [Oceanobacillus profundus]|uniref:hypothetical protein n=1 Tax=Oceanobacillus TaxID=182709 RepID=UPI001314AB24|nr:hypothetical protein [Oceanobacillus profundus]MCM3397311.1 hypothetical protein [Oceanobacillus profundus]MDO6449556.1 hypothetical protein [Oceanobacillus profundus]